MIMISKKKGQDEYSYKFIGIDTNTVEYYMETISDESPLEKEYCDFVYENYLQVPDDNRIDEVRNAYADIIDTAPDNMTASEKLTVLGSLRDRINSSTDYTLSPGETPSNRDFVNYFLIENRKGFSLCNCRSFAFKNGGNSRKVCNRIRNCRRRF